MKTGILIILGCLVLIALASAPTAHVSAVPLAQATLPTLSATPRDLGLPLVFGPNPTYTTTPTPSSTYTPGPPTQTPTPGISAEALFIRQSWDATYGWRVWVSGVVTNTHPNAIEIEAVACHVLDAGGEEIGVIDLETCMPVIGAFSSGPASGNAVFDVPQERRPTNAYIVPSWHLTSKGRAELPTEHWFGTAYIYDAEVTVLSVRVTNPYSRRVSGELLFATEANTGGCTLSRFTLEPGGSFMDWTYLNRLNSTNRYFRYWAVFDPDEVLPTSTPSFTPSPTITPTPTPEGCFNSTDSFQSAPFQAQSGVFTAEFDVSIPSLNRDELSAVVGLSKNPATTHAHLGPIVGISGALGAWGEIPYQVQARDGDEYRADNEVPVDYGMDIHVRMVVNVSAHIYSVYVSAPGRPEVTVATNYAFRTEQSSVTSLGYWSVWSGPGWIDACAFELTP